MTRHAKGRTDRRRAAALLTLAAVLLGGLWLDQRPNNMPTMSAPPAHDVELRQRFDQAALMLHARQYEYAATALQRVLTLAPGMPEAHVNLGYALLGLNRPAEARGAFEQAAALRPAQANAYYGLALAWEAAGDLAMATGAMRSYLHLARDERPEHLSRARAALWEWQQAPRPAAAASAPSRPLAAELHRPRNVPDLRPPSSPPGS